MRGGVLQYAAQASPPIDAEIAGKGHRGTETGGTPSAGRCPSTVRPRLPPLLVLLCVASPASAQVVVDGSTWRSLQPPAPLTPFDPRGVVVMDREVELDRAEDALVVRARWTLDAPRPLWFAEPLIGPGARVESLLVDGEPAPSYARRDGYAPAIDVNGPRSVELVATLPWPEGPGVVPLALLPAARGAVALGEGLALEASDAVPVAPGRQASGAEHLVVIPAPPRVRRGDDLWARGRVALGLVVHDDRVEARARLELRALRGELAEVRARVGGTGDRPTVRSSPEGSVSWRGDELLLRLDEPTDERVVLHLGWGRGLTADAEQRLPLPELSLRDAARTERSLQLGRDAGVEVVPHLDGWGAVGAAELPAWGRGLVEGEPVGAFVDGAGGGALQVLRFEPAPRPVAVVQVAELTAASSAGGATLLQARYEVLNDRAAALWVELPAGARLLVAQVGGEAVTLSLEGGRLRVPLLRSLETVSGLLTVPVELGLLLGGEPWGRRGPRTLDLPRVDAPVRVARTTWHLPPGYRRAGRAPRGLVESFDEGGDIAYGFDAAAHDKRGVADESFQAAQRAWLDNDFAGAQSHLDDLVGLGASNDNISRLQSNLDLVQGKGGGEAVALERRVKEQAQARAEADYRRYEEASREAEELLSAGDYGAAEVALDEALAVGGTLEALEQDGTVEVERRNRQLACKRKVARAATAAVASRVGWEGKPDRDYGAPLELVTTGVGSGGGGYGSGYGVGFGGVASRGVKVLAVGATTRGLLVPRSGPAVLFQHLLLPAGGELSPSLRFRRAHPRNGVP